MLLLLTVLKCGRSLVIFFDFGISIEGLSIGIGSKRSSRSLSSLGTLTAWLVFYLFLGVIFSVLRLFVDLFLIQSFIVGLTKLPLLPNGKTSLCHLPIDCCSYYSLTNLLSSTVYATIGDSWFIRWIALN
jgi:hypothetical protein